MSSSVWEATNPITSGLPPGGTLNGAFYSTSFVYPTSWQQCQMLQSRCLKGCISRCAVKSYRFTSGLPPGGTLRDVFYNTSFAYPTCWFWLFFSESWRISFNMVCTDSMFMVVRSHFWIYDILWLVLLPCTAPSPLCCANTISFSNPRLFLVGSLAFHHCLLVVWTQYLYCTLLCKYCAVLYFTVFTYY
jgi:hypothetical protein